jgi:hypothetical protein
LIARRGLPSPGEVVQFRAHVSKISMNDWGPTQRVSAEVVLAKGGVLVGDLHLLARTAYPLDPESPLDMLNRTEPFFALTLAEGGAVFVSKIQVSMLSCWGQSQLRDPDRASAAKLVALEVELADGTKYQGRSTFELPPSRSRALDYVNGPGQFFVLWTDDLTRYVNKSLVRLIRPLD